MLKGTLHKLENKWVVAWRDNNKSHHVLDLHPDYAHESAIKKLSSLLGIRLDELNGMEIYFQKEFLDYDLVSDIWFNEVARPIDVKQLSGHYCYGCNSFFHDSNPDVKEHEGCTGNKNLGICVDSTEFNYGWKDFVDDVPLRAWHNPIFFLEFVESKYHPPKKLSS